MSDFQDELNHDWNSALDAIEKEQYEKALLFLNKLESYRLKGEIEESDKRYPIRLKISYCLISLNDFESAYQIILNLIDEDVTTYEIWLYLGYIHYMCEDDDDALNYAEECMAMYPLRKEGWELKTSIMKSMGKSAEEINNHIDLQYSKTEYDEDGDEDGDEDSDEDGDEDGDEYEYRELRELR